MKKNKVFFQFLIGILLYFAILVTFVLGLLDNRFYLTVSIVLFIVYLYLFWYNSYQKLKDEITSIKEMLKQ